MSEEVKDQQENQEPVEEKKEEAKTEEPKETLEAKEQAPESQEKAAETKVKKINRLSMDQLNRKISEMETKNLQKSIYYKHLIQRKKEIEGYTAE